jgi:methionyl-tRNA synthetase
MLAKSFANSSGAVARSLRIFGRTTDLAMGGSALQMPRKSLSEAERLDSVVYYVTESLRIIAILISPVLPKAAHRIFDQLNWKMDLSEKEERFSLTDAEWGRLPDGHVVGKPTPLFPRIEPSDL